VKGAGYSGRARSASQGSSSVGTSTTPIGFTKFTTMSTVGPHAKRTSPLTLAQETLKEQLITALDNILMAEPPSAFAGKYILLEERALGGQSVVQVRLANENKSCFIGHNGLSES
jgi:hypothetical protein